MSTTRAYALAKVTGGRGRKLTDEFLRLKSHHFFESHFCRVRRPNEKGHVEVLVGYARRAFLVPVPAARGGLEPLNADLEARCRADLARKLWGKPATKAELLEQERPALLPAVAFERMVREHLGEVGGALVLIRALWEGPRLPFPNTKLAT